MTLQTGFDVVKFRIGQSLLLLTIKKSVDQDRRPGRFLLTGSADILTLPTVSESLAGRFVVSEIKKQSEWYSESLFLSHYRDKDHNEVDLLCEDRSGRIVAIEIKASMTVTPADLRGIKKLREILGERLVLALVLYEGTRTFPLGDNIFTAPVSILWGKGV